MSRHADAPGPESFAEAAKALHQLPARKRCSLPNQQEGSASYSAFPVAGWQGNLSGKRGVLASQEPIGEAGVGLRDQLAQRVDIGICAPGIIRSPSRPHEDELPVVKCRDVLAYVLLQLANRW
jgi:hypothetical protein